MRIFLALLVSLLLAAPLQAAEKTSNALQQSLLWRIERAGLPDSWLFGTNHAVDPDIAILPKAVATAIDGSRLVITELKLDDRSAEANMAARMFTPESALPALLGDAYYRKLALALKPYGLPEDAIAHLKAWVIWITLIQPPRTAAIPLDMQIAQYGKKAGIPNQGIESAEEQLALLESIDDARLARLIRALLDHQNEYRAMLQQINAAWLQGDLATLAKISRQADPFIAAEDREWELQFQRTMIDDRNLRMADRLRPLLAKGGAFIAIGAAHLPGATGLVTQLKQQGYRLTPVKLEFQH